MTVSPETSLASLQAELAERAFAFVRGGAMRAMLEHIGPLDDWPAFADSWNDLSLDTYMADGGRYRRRRYAVYTVPAQGPPLREPHQAHYQSLDYNPIHGGIERWFEPVSEELGHGPSLTTILSCCQTLFSGLAPQVASWHVEVHQFRIEARQGESGRPTPEGLHRDGVDYVLVLLVERCNIAKGVTGVSDLLGRALGSFTLTDPFDAALVDDRRVAHGVTPVEAIEAGRPAHRDVLVVTFRERAAASSSPA